MKLDSDGEWTTVHRTELVNYVSFTAPHICFKRIRCLSLSDSESHYLFIAASNKVT